jgi:CRP-like cAMP-binding protein
VSSVSTSKVLAAVENLKQHELEIIDYCKVRTLSAFERYVKQGDVLPYLIIVLRGSLNLVLPTPPEEELEEEASKKRGIARFRQIVNKAKLEMQVIRRFEFGHVQSGAEQVVPMGHVSANQSTNNLIANIGAWRVLAESHVVLQQPYYADIVCTQDATEVLELHAPPTALEMLRRNGKDGIVDASIDEADAQDVNTQDQTQQKVGFLRLASAEQRILNAHNRLFLSV